MSDWIPLSEPGTLPAACGLYIIRHRESGKLYVGKSVNVRRRVYNHRTSDSPHYLHRAVRKHGPAAFDVRLHAVGTEEAMTRLEILMIASLGCMAPVGFNGTIGGDGASGARHTEEMNRKNSERQKGIPKHSDEAKRLLSEQRLAHNPFKGRKHTPEARAKMGAAAVALHTGKKRSAETRANISASLMGRAAPVLSPEARARVAEANRRPNAKKAHKGEANGMHGVRGREHPAARRVGVWAPEAMVPLIFDTVTEAAEWCGVKPASICDWCVGRYRPKNGNLFAYL